MSLIKLTKDLENFQWTDYDNVGANNSQIKHRHGGFEGGGQPPHPEEHSLLDDGAGENLSQIKGRHGGTLPGGQPPHPSDHSELDNGAGVPQSFYDGHSKVVTGQKTFERPNPKSLADMKSKFGPLNTQPLERGPYGVTDYMDGTKQGRGFIPPGGHPLGFTVDMGVSEYAIGDPLNYALTPLSHTIAAVNSNGPHGSVTEQTINLTPVAPNAWAEDFMTTPLANYVSQYSEPVDSLTHEVTMITLTGPTAPDSYQTELNVIPKIDGAHGSDFMTLPISGYPGLYVGSQGDIVPIIPSVLGLGESDSIAATWPDKIFHQLGNLQDEKLYDVYQHHFLPTIENFNHISLLTDLFEDESISVATEKWRDGSVHIGTQDWAAPVGGGVTSWANLMPITPRYSMFRDAQGNYQVPTLFPHEWVNQPTFNVLGGYPESTYGGGYTINSQFGFSWNDLAGWFMETIDDSGQGDATNYSSAHGAHSFEVGDINIDLYESMPKYHLDTPLAIKWHLTKENIEEWPYKQFGFTNSPEYTFNEGSLDMETSTGALVFATQPFIRRQVGQGYLEGRSEGVVGIDHLATVIARVEEDTTRINAWLNTPAGKNWHGNQYSLQSLNPRPETRLYNPLSLITSLVPHFHGQRHVSDKLFLSLLGPGKYGDLGTDKDYYEDDDAPIWGYGRIGSGTENTFKRSRLTRLTDKFLWDKDEGPSALTLALEESMEKQNFALTREIAIAIEDWSATNRGRTPKTPTQVVFSQKSAYGQGPIHKKNDNFPNSGLGWLNNNLGAAGVVKNLKRSYDHYQTSNYLALDPNFAYITYFGKWHSPLVSGWAYLDPTGFDASDVRYRDDSYGGGIWMNPWAKFKSFPFKSDKLLYSTGFGEGERPDPGTISWTIAGDGTAWSVGDFLKGLDKGEYGISSDKGVTHSELIDVTNQLPLGYTSLTALYGSPRQTAEGESSHPIWMMPDGSYKPAPTHSPDYLTLKYSEIGNKDRFGSNWSKYFGSDYSGFPSGILRYSWRFFDPGNEKGKLYWGDSEGTKAVETNVPEGINLNVFTLGKGSHGNLNPRQALFWEEGKSEASEITETPDPLLPGILPGKTTRTTVTIISLLKNGKWSIGHGTAPRSSADINFLVLPYQNLDIKTSYGKELGRNPWPIDDDRIYFSSLIKHSWRFFDKSHKDRKDPYWDYFEAEHYGVRKVQAEFEETVDSLIEDGKVFTINKRAAKGTDTSGNQSENLLKRYSTLSYGAIPDSPTFARPEDIKDDALHGKYNYEKTLRSAGELNLNADDKDARPDWLKALSAADGSGVRDKTKKIVDDIGQPGQAGVPIVKDDILGVIKKGLDKENYKNDQTDKVNLTPYGSKTAAHGEGAPQPDGANDFIKFKFRDITNNKFIIFRAILSGISDSITPEWTGTRYIGRPDQVYVYQGAERKVVFSLDIYPKTKQELPVLWEKINYLVGLCYPSYVSNRMVAPFIELTIGDMLVNTPGFLDSLSVGVNDLGTWEIEPGLQLPKHITCQCSFTYVGKYIQAQKGKHYELGWLPDGLNSDTSIHKENINFRDWPDRANTGTGFNNIKPLFNELGQQD